MMKDLIYWMEYYLSKRRGYKLENGFLSESLFPLSICLFFNALTLMYVLEYYTSWELIREIPIRSRRHLASWLYAVLLLLPFCLGLYFVYFRGDRLKRLIKKYKYLSSRRQYIGRFFFWLYVLGSIGAFFFVFDFFYH